MRASQGWVWCVQLLRALIGRGRVGGLRGVALVVAVVGAASLALASVSPGLAAPGDQVLAWGRNLEGQLGNGASADSNVPVSTSLPAGTTVTAIAGGGFHSLALTSTGQVLAGGDNGDGQLGNGTNTNSNVPVSTSLPAGTTVTAIAGGGSHSLALTSTGQVLAGGDNGDGQLGNGTNNPSNVPVSVSLPAGKTVTAVAGGTFHSSALTSTGQVLAWGANGAGQLGNGTNNPSNVPVSVSLPAGKTVTAVAARGLHSLALTSTGQVLAWGANGAGQLGNGTNTDSNIPVPTSLPAGTTVTAVAAGTAHSLALTSTGQVLAWGSNGDGQLGNGNNTNRNVPVSASPPAGTIVTGVAAGGFHSLALATSAPPPTPTTMTMTMTMTTTVTTPTTMTTTVTGPTTTVTGPTTTVTKTVTNTTTKTTCCHEENTENNSDNSNEDHEHHDNNNDPWRLGMAR